MKFSIRKPFAFVRTYDRNRDDRYIYRATVIDDTPDEGPMPLITFLDAMNAALVSIPEEHRATAQIVLALDDWDCGTRPTLDVYVDRMETAEEYTSRMGQEKAEATAKKRQSEAAERATFERLKAKYG